MNESSIGRYTKIYFPFPLSCKTLLESLPYYITDLQVMQYIWEVCLTLNVKQNYVSENIVSDMYETFFLTADEILEEETREGEIKTIEYDNIDFTITEVITQIQSVAEEMFDTLGIEHHPALSLFFQSATYVDEINLVERVFCVSVDYDQSYLYREEFENES